MQCTLNELKSTKINVSSYKKPDRLINDKTYIICFCRHVCFLTFCVRAFSYFDGVVLLTTFVCLYMSFGHFDFFWHYDFFLHFILVVQIHVICLYFSTDFVSLSLFILFHMYFGMFLRCCLLVCLRFSVASCIFYSFSVVLFWLFGLLVYGLGYVFLYDLFFFILSFNYRSLMLTSRNTKDNTRHTRWKMSKFLFKNAIYFHLIFTKFVFISLTNRRKWLTKKLLMKCLPSL